MIGTLQGRLGAPPPRARAGGQVSADGFASISHDLHTNFGTDWCLPGGIEGAAAHRHIIYEESDSNARVPCVDWEILGTTDASEYPMKPLAPGKAKRRWVPKYTLTAPMSFSQSMHGTYVDNPFFFCCAR